jgi:O-antigen/teichoic acid export membrane protein
MMGQGAVFILSLLLTPWIIKNLGTGGYGFYTLMWSSLSYLLILNAGSISAAQCFTAQWHLLEDRKATLAALLKRTLRYEIAAGVCGGLGLFLSRNFLSNHLLHGSPALLALGPSVFALLALAVPAYFVSQFALAVVWGLKRFSLYNVLIALQALLMTGGASLILFSGFGLKTIAVLFILAQIFLALIGVWLIRPVLRGPTIKLDRHDAWDYISFCAKSALPLFLVTLISQGDRAVIGLWLPLTQLGYYALSATLAQKFNAIAASVAATSFPILAELIGKGEHERLKRIYLKSAELSFFMLLPIAILSFILIPQFISLWLGSAFSDSCTWPFRILVIANILNLAMSMPNTLAVGKGSPHWISYLWAGKALIALSLWVYMIPHWGIVGVALGSLIAELVVAGPFLKRVHAHMLGLGLIEFFVTSLKWPLIASTGLAVFGFLLHGMIGSWLGLISFAFFGAAIYGVLAYFILDAESKRLIAKEIALKF